LDIYTKKVGSDIGKFNEHVNHLLEGLAAHGQMTMDLLTNLYKGYANASDVKFVEYIARKQEAYEEGDLMGDQMKEAKKLMTLVENKYKDL
jgi:hypothetical protein